jgi:hypothetical protein
VPRLLTESEKRRSATNWISSALSMPCGKYLGSMLGNTRNGCSMPSANGLQIGRGDCLRYGIITAAIEFVVSSKEQPVGQVNSGYGSYQTIPRQNKPD